MWKHILSCLGRLAMLLKGEKPLIEDAVDRLLTHREHLPRSLRTAMIAVNARLEDQERQREAFIVEKNGFRAALPALGYALPNDGSQMHLFQNFMLADALISWADLDLIYVSLASGCAMPTTAFLALTSEQQYAAVAALLDLVEHLQAETKAWNAVRGDVAQAPTACA